MDINGLPDDLLVKILSFLPTKVAISTCVLSKRWEFLWMWLPNLEFTPLKYPVNEIWEFVNKKLPLHKALVIATLRLHTAWYYSHTKPEDINEDIKRWIDIAVSRHVRELDIEYYSYYDHITENLLPSSLFTCKSLVTLKIKYITLMDLPSRVYLPSLKTFQLETESSFTVGKSLQQLLSNCPVLEDLSVDFSYIRTLREFTIIVPSLQSLSLFLRSNYNLDGYEIDTPSLKYLKLVDWNNEGHYSLIKNMPMLREAYVDNESINPKNMPLIKSITSVKRLTICCSEDSYVDGCVFKELEQLNLCVCREDSSHLLGKLLKGSPNLRELDISVMHVSFIFSCIVSWNQPSSVPECLLSSLQIFNWSEYLVTPEERDIAVYIFKNACHLKKATII
ncbi:unnamed protein product, partial [Arabidopsis halleri]